MMPIISALQRQRQEDPQKFRANLITIASSQTLSKIIIIINNCMELNLERKDLFA